MRNSRTKFDAISRASLRATLLTGVVLALSIDSFTLAETAADTSSAQSPSLAGHAEDALNVLILGDSLALCGFGKRLDERFRTHPAVKSAFSYMACGTTPASWLKERPYANVKTRCGFWTIESVQGRKEPKVLRDSYGMDHGGAPKPHDVPKIEDLLASTEPNVLVMQNENNLFGVFAGRTTVQPERDGPAVRRYIAPFVSKIMKTPSPLRKLYWVASPVSGRVPKEIQDFVLEQIRSCVGSAGVVIDSRTLVSYPYRHMEPDKEHFEGPDMDRWADRVFEIVERDLAAHSLAASKPLHELAPAAAEQPNATAATAKEPPLVVSAKLVAKSTPIPLQNLLPYQESLVTFVYEVKKVIAGNYTERQILVARPACISLRMQPLQKYKIGRTHKLRLRPLRSTAWNTAKCKDDSGLINLEPYIAIEDEAKYPGAAH